MMDGLTKWLIVEQVADALETTRDRDAWMAIMVGT